MSGLAFSSEAATRLIAAYRAPDLVRQRDATLQRLNLKRGERVVDIGCGPGFLCETMAAAVGPTGQVIGMGDAAALPVDAGQFDLAVSTQVLEYVADADTALREIARVLRPGGRAFIVDTDFDTWVWYAADAERMTAIIKSWDVHCADPRLPRTLSPRLRAAGFKVVNVEAYPVLSTTYRPGDFCYGLSQLMADFLPKRGFDPQVLKDWLADLADTEARNASFFSLNRYFFSVEKT